MIKVVLASQNPVKIQSVKTAFSKIFQTEIQVSGLKIKLDIPDQPMSDGDTLRCATLRAEAAKTNAPEANFWVGIEGGVDFRNGEAEAFGWVVVLSSVQKGQARSATFTLPPLVARLLKSGKELGAINDDIFQTHNSKQSGGAVGLLTKNILQRDELYQQAVLLALIPFLNPQLYNAD